MVGYLSSTRQYIRALTPGSRLLFALRCILADACCLHQAMNAVSLVQHSQEQCVAGRQGSMGLVSWSGSTCFVSASAHQGDELVALVLLEKLSEPQAMLRRVVRKVYWLVRPLCRTNRQACRVGFANFRPCCNGF
ncbi:hypothetical protein COO60DRAFT_516630 [Scenedesmus sp. NREL 46B-D3]|nr:hypothetical protein COO60DRAFT_516630 [Scenedesmus sp. NREL 46B-D3]